MKILIIGRTGQLGSMLVKDATASGHEVLAPCKDELDIMDMESFMANVKCFLPDLIINTAAFHNVPLCEVEITKAFQFNCIAVKNMAEISNRFNSWFMSFSTDYVFDGKIRTLYTESDAPAPLQIYGLSKLAGEYASFAYNDKSIILRTCGLYGLQGASSKGGNFVDKIIKESEKNIPLEISSDQTVCPTYTGDLSKAVLQLIEHKEKKSGIYHLVNEGYCSWYEFTKEIFRIMDIKTEVLPVDRKGKTEEMKRPLFSALKNEKAAKLGIILPHWKEALKEYLFIKYGVVSERNKGI